MIKHIVMWNFKHGEEGKRDLFLKNLLALKDEIEVIRSMEVGVKAFDSNDYDAVLIAEFDSPEDLQSYKTDPRHVAVSELCSSIRTARAAIDIEE